MAKSKLFRLILLNFVLACLTNYSYSQTLNDSLAVKVDSIFQRFNSKSKPGAVVAIIENGKVAFEKCYGMANLEYDIPLTTSSAFDIASVSKQFTGFAISTLIEEGKINLNDDVRKYLPQVPSFGKPITIKHLLYHTSGLRDWSGALQTAGWRYTELASFNDVMKMVSKQKELDFETGTQYSYCNLGYNLLAAVIEKVSGQSFKNWTKENIFRKLGMNSSSFWDDNSLMTKNMAYSYYLDNGEYGNYPNVNTAYGSSTLRTTLDDLTKWVIFFQNAILSKKPVIVRMIQNGTLDNGDPLNYGFGLEVRYKNTDPDIIFHTGAWAGYRTIIKNHINDKISFIVL
jgi:CubicO group peptidase (beta-lactamase class C family)